jgi:heat shock protein beta-11
MTNVKTEVILSTCVDERYPAANIVDGKPNTYFVTTGLYPHEIILGVKGGSTNISRIVLTSSGIKKLRLEKCTDVAPSKFETIVDCEVANRENNGRQVEQFQLNKATAGSGVTFLKVVIASGYEEFAGVYELSIEGDAPSGSS